MVQFLKGFLEDSHLIASAGRNKNFQPDFAAWFSEKKCVSLGVVLKTTADRGFGSRVWRFVFLTVISIGVSV
jgi:hypothetical protein